MRCTSCGAEADSKFCPYCGSQMPYSGPEQVYTDNSQQTIINNYYVNPNAMPMAGNPNMGYCSPKSRAITLLLAVCTGYFGGHYFYLGRWGMGLLYFFTVGLFGIGYIVDIFRGLVGAIPDSRGLLVSNW